MQFRIYGTKENPLFLAKDVAEWIEHSNASVMLSKVDEEEKVINIVYTLGGNQEAWFLTEDGLYEVLMQSRKPIAKEFKKEVKKILKQIRLTGGYVPARDEDEKVVNNVHTLGGNQEAWFLTDEEEKVCVNNPYALQGQQKQCFLAEVLNKHIRSRKKI